MASATLRSRERCAEGEEDGRQSMKLIGNDCSLMDYDLDYEEGESSSPFLSPITLSLLPRLLLHPR